MSQSRGSRHGSIASLKGPGWCRRRVLGAMGCEPSPSLAWPGTPQAETSGLRLFAMPEPVVNPLTEATRATAWMPGVSQCPNLTINTILSEKTNPSPNSQRSPQQDPLVSAIMSNSTATNLLLSGSTTTGTAGLMLCTHPSARAGTALAQPVVGGAEEPILRAAGETPPGSVRKRDGEIRL